MYRFSTDEMIYGVDNIALKFLKCNFTLKASCLNVENVYLQIIISIHPSGSAVTGTDTILRMRISTTHEEDS